MSKRLVTPAMVVNAMARDVASGRPDAEDLFVAFADARIRGNWATEKASDWWLGGEGRRKYRETVAWLHRMLGTDSIEIEWKED